VVTEAEAMVTAAEAAEEARTEAEAVGTEAEAEDGTRKTEWLCCRGRSSGAEGI